MNIVAFQRALESKEAKLVLREQVKNWLPAVSRVISVFNPHINQIVQLRRILGLKNNLVDDAICQVLLSRAINTKTNPREFLALDHDSQKLPHYSNIKNMELAAQTIKTAWQTGQKVGVVGDYDADGITSVAQMVLCARRMGYEHLIKWSVPDRFKDGYGISQSIAEQLVSNGCKVVVLLDHGTKSHAVINYLQSKGVKVVVIDHHLPGKELPNAIVVNPEQEGCKLQTEKLCASGLTAFLSNALSGSCDFSLASIGTIADMVPMFGVNRIIARQGLMDLQKKCPAAIFQLAVLLDQSKDISDLGSEDIGFNYAPILNASGRVAHASKAVEFLIATDPEKILQLANELYSLNEQRKQLQRAGNLMAEEQLTKFGLVPKTIVLADTKFHPGVVGLLAAHLAGRYARPAGSLAVDDDKISGSFRQGDARVNLVGLLDNVAEYLARHGGHKAAAGATLAGNNPERFIAALILAFDRQYENNLSHLDVRADLEMPLKDLTASFVQRMDQVLSPYGQGFEPPKILVKNLELIRFIDGERSISAIVSDGKKEVTARFSLECWNNDLQPGDCLGVVARPVMIFRKQKQTVQLVVEAYQKTNVKGSIKARAEATLDFQKTFGFANEEKSSVSVSKVAEHGRMSQSTFKFFDELRVFNPNLTPVNPRRVANSDPIKFVRKSLAPTIKELRNIASTFASRFLYSELEAHFDDPFSSTRTDVAKHYQDFLRQQELDLVLANKLEYRPYQAELVRFAREHRLSMIVDGPTASGKTELGLFLAAQVIKQGGNVLFVAPTREIADQTFKRAKACLHESVDVVYLDGATTPKKRAELYRQHPQALWVAVPHAIKNDLKSGVLVKWPWDLLLVDEGHYSRGEYPYTELIRRANGEKTKTILFSGSPGEPKSTKKTLVTWENLERIRLLLGDEAIIYTLNKIPRVSSIIPQVSKYEAGLVRERQVLQSIVKSISLKVLEQLNELGTDKLADDINSGPSAAIFKLYGKKLANIPSGFEFKESGIVIQFKKYADLQPELYKQISRLFVLKELGETYRRLEENGMYSCLAGALEQYVRIYFPCGKKTPAYLTDFFSNRDIRLFFNAISRGPFEGIWRNKDSLVKAFGIDLKSFDLLSSKKQQLVINRALLEFKQKARQYLADLEYSDSLKEEELFKIIEKNRTSQGIIFVKEKEQVSFLVSRLNARLAKLGINAVGLTGGVNKKTGTLSSKSDEHALERFRSKECNLLVGTSVIDQGIDIPRVDYGINFNFTGALIEALQRAGRLGRDGGPGNFYFIIGSGADQGKFQIILRKYKLNLERLIEQRQILLDKYGDKTV